MTVVASRFVGILEYNVSSSGTTMIESIVRLCNGVVMPRLGLGVWQAGNDRETCNVVLTALEAGYRHIDTASYYGNEAGVGQAVRASGLSRSDIFVTTKLWNSDHGFNAALKAFDKSFSKLAIEYVDLFLIHWPVIGLRLESWKALEKLYLEGRVKAIGVSNYMVNHLEELKKLAGIQPMVNQIEVHPFLQHNEVRRWCAEHSVVVQAYSPLTRGYLINNQTVGEIALSNGKTNAQILLRWGLQKGMVVLPKSVRQNRIIENSQIFDFSLSERDMASLDELETGRATGWDPRKME